MANYRTAQGKSLDMAALAAKNEKVRAVGNMKINARGDIIDGQGRVIKPATQKVAEQYQKTVGNKSALPKKSKVPKVVEQKTMEEQELDEMLSDEIEVEQIKTKETKK
jgi:hypothetical protein